MDKEVKNNNNLFISYSKIKEDKMEIDKSKKINKNDINKNINFCSRCGGKHFDLSCIYFKN